MIFDHLPINAQKAFTNNNKPHYSQTPTVESLDRFWLNDTSARSTAPKHDRRLRRR